MAEGMQALKGIDPQALAAFIQSLTETQKGYAATGGNMGPTVYDAHKAARQRDDLVQKYLGDVSQTRAMTDAMNKIIEEHAQKNARLGRSVSREKDIGVTAPELAEEQATPKLSDDVNFAATLANALKGPLANEQTAVNTVKTQSEGGGDTLNNKTPAEMALEGLSIPLNADVEKRPDRKNAKTNADALTESAKITATATENAAHESKAGATDSETYFGIDPATKTVKTYTKQKSSQTTDSTSRTDTKSIENNATAKKLLKNPDAVAAVVKAVGDFRLAMDGNQLYAYSKDSPNKRVPISDAEAEQNEDY